MTAQKASKREYYFRLLPCNTEVIRQALEKEGYQVLQVMN